MSIKYAIKVVLIPKILFLNIFSLFVSHKNKEWTHVVENQIAFLLIVSEYVC